ncbi:pyridoxal phosphate-dependent decarboxylase family protein [Pseudonocardia acaciae]|uniref:pyridoxal phosphate-dependent decarboxylase family protein n=1 Tax=Pseudonocardia acaciae TaxID=551276 RepID=UPI00048C7CB3|nr:aminotransferase class I/II-fold pyridoxal phosphate-dependent enzyme [Pseudonocardia acaciae]
MPDQDPSAIPEFDLRRDGYAAVDWAANYLEKARELPVMAQVSPGDIASALPERMPETAEPFSDVLADLDRVILPGITHWQHPRFFSYFATTSSEPAILAEMLAATLNQVSFIWRASPASTELETVTMSWLADLLGLDPAWHGHIEDTASTSTLAALVAARHASGRHAVVFSEHAHSSVEKDARILGMQPRPMPTDEAFRMRTAAVAEQLARGDVAAVVSTAGTTSSASFDPTPELAELCARHGAWLHVDAAYAGSAWACPELRDSQAGVAEADSLVVNPHKWLLVPMDCSALFTRRPAALREAFTIVPEYLRTTDEAANLSDYGPALGRRFRSLKLWAAMRCFGRAGIQEFIRRSVGLAHEFAGWVEADPRWELVHVSLSLACFRFNGTDEENLAIVERVNRGGQIFITHTRLSGRIVLRLAVGYLHTTREDVQLAWSVLNG